MFAGRATAAGAAGPSAVVAGGKAGKFSVEELYGFTKKPKVNRGTSGKQEKSSGRKEVKEKEESDLASQILEAARRLMERRRLEIYLKECDVTMEQSTMAYRYTTGEGLSWRWLTDSLSNNRRCAGELECNRWGRVRCWR
ncbi:hypothetical protein ATANTOWER_007493 [Ataeniobius toweri]|uniref:Uncharacterized protein n=1 Tax=Ataeniobius toweri TaxID=208326 RepID=A0ABU7BZF2_9TELE|nr:hypothetical protein [Ataeniobius toweri]